MIGTIRFGIMVAVPETVERSLDKTDMDPETLERSLGQLHTCSLFFIDK